MSSAAKQATSAVTIGTFPSARSTWSIRRPSAASPERTTSTGSAFQAGKKGWFTKQRSGRRAPSAIRARGRPEVLGGRLEHVLAPGELLQLQRRHEPLSRRLRVAGRQLPARDGLPHVTL